MIIKTQPRQPLATLDQNPTEPSIGTATPTGKFKTQSSDLKQINYQHQFKVGVHQNDKSRMNDQLMSPLCQRKDGSILRSPFAKTFSTTQLLQSPAPAKPQRHLSQNAIEYTTTDNLQKEIQLIKYNNTNLQQQIGRIETEIFRGNSTSFIKELDKKIQLLTNLNEKLKNDNKQLQSLLNLDGLKSQKNAIESQRASLVSELEQINKEMTLYDLEQLQNRIEEAENNNPLTQLICELDDKVQGLIEENIRLNDVIANLQTQFEERARVETEITKLRSTISKNKSEESQLKMKIDQLNKQMNHGSAESKQKLQEEKLKLKIRDLQVENNSLKSMIRDIDYSEEIRDIEERINIIADDNSKLEKKLIKK
ncbi:hypothetical protein pb186bvf_000930 [Paramecium bursaria]